MAANYVTIVQAGIVHHIRVHLYYVEHAILARIIHITTDPFSKHPQKSKHAIILAISDWKKVQKIQNHAKCSSSLIGQWQITICCKLIYTCDNSLLHHMLLFIINQAKFMNNMFSRTIWDWLLPTTIQSRYPKLQLKTMLLLIQKFFSQVSPSVISFLSDQAIQKTAALFHQMSNILLKSCSPPPQLAVVHWQYPFLLRRYIVDSNKSCCVP